MKVAGGDGLITIEKKTKKEKEKEEKELEMEFAKVFIFISWNLPSGVDVSFYYVMLRR